MATSDFLNKVLERFPGKDDESRCLSLAYGSGVFDQTQSIEQSSGNMTDFIFVVENTQAWHQQNLELNPSDYSGLMRQLGPKLIADAQAKYGAQMYFNTLVPYEEGHIKYGVISRSDFISDLLDWDTLYAAGRLQKPVRILERPDKDIDQELHLALRMNLTSAMHTALLLLPDRFSEDQLFMTLTSLSYMGDFRMTVGEDRNKVAKIVLGAKPHFLNLYGKRITKMKQFIHKDPNTGIMEQDVSPSGRHHHLTMLPKNVQLMLEAMWNSDGRTRDLEDVLRAAAFERDSGEVITECLKAIVKGPAVSQALKGIVTAGTCKTVIYSYAKLIKMVKSIKPSADATNKSDSIF